MARPLKWKSTDAQSGTGVGEAEQIKGHDELGLFVQAYNGFDPGTDSLEVRIEGTVDPDQTDGVIEHFAPIDRGAPDVDNSLFLDQSDFVESNEDSSIYVAYVGQNSFPIEAVRANITTHSGGFDVDSWVLVTGAGEAAYRYSEPEGP